MFPEEVSQSISQPGAGDHCEDSLEAKDGDSTHVTWVQDLLHEAGHGLSVDLWKIVTSNLQNYLLTNLVLLGIDGEHPPGPGGPVPEVGQELPEL